MADRVVGGDGAWAQLPDRNFWVLTDVPDRFVATAIWMIEQNYNPEREQDGIQWFAPVDEGTEQNG